MVATKITVFCQFLLIFYASIHLTNSTQFYEWRWCPESYRDAVRNGYLLASRNKFGTSYGECLKVVPLARGKKNKGFGLKILTNTILQKQPFQIFIVFLYTYIVVQPPNKHLPYKPTIMLKNHLKIALRVFSKEKSFTFINIMGLAIGLAVTLLIIQYVRFEFSYENTHQNPEKIVRLTMDYLIGWIILLLELN